MQRLKGCEDGAVLVIVAVCLVVLIGAGALAVDAGALYQEHRELQNGADAAALAVAQDCAQDPTDLAACGAYDDTAAYYADGNAEDGASAAEVDMSQWPQSRVRVNTTGQVTLFFARIFGIDMGETTATAVATYGPTALGSIPTLPITLSQCEYDAGKAAQGDALFDEDDLSGAGTEWVIPLLTHGPANPSEEDPEGPTKPGKGGGKPDDPGTGGGKPGGDDEGGCQPVTQPGHDVPGGFGWVHNTGECKAQLEGDKAGVDTGNDLPSPCKKEGIHDLLYHKIVHLPVFTAVEGSGATGEYTFVSYAAFYVTGYKFPSAKYPTGINCAASDPSATCLKGYFMNDSTVQGEAGTGPDYGLRSVSLDE